MMKPSPLVIDLLHDDEPIYLSSDSDDEPIIASTKPATKRPATTAAGLPRKLPKENIPPHSNAAVSAAASSYDSDASSNYDRDVSSNYDSDVDSSDDDCVLSDDERKPAKPAAKTPSARGPNFSSSKRSWNLSPFRLSHDGNRDALLSACDARLDEVSAYFSCSPGLEAELPRFPEVVEYVKRCLRAICPRNLSIILQLKCPVPKLNPDGETISLALGGNCPDNMRRGVCTIRCADEFFGIEKLSTFFIFNCRVKCRIDCKSGRCAIISWIEAEALFRVYEVLCVFAHAVGAKIGFISVAGSTTEIGKKLGRFLEGATHDDGTPFIAEGVYLPNGHHLSLCAYYCDLFRTVEKQVSVQF